MWIKAIIFKIYFMNCVLCFICKIGYNKKNCRVFIITNGEIFFIYVKLCAYIHYIHFSRCVLRIHPLYEFYCYPCLQAMIFMITIFDLKLSQYIHWATWKSFKWSLFTFKMKIILKYSYLILLEFSNENLGLILSSPNTT